MYEDHALEEDRAAPMWQRALLAMGIALAAVNVLGLGAYATWVDQEVDQVQVQSGTLGISLGADGVANRLYIDAVDIAPGDTIQRVVTLTNDGSIDLSQITLSTTGSAGSLLFTGADRLDLRVRSCSTAWTESQNADGIYSYTCPSGATTTDVLGPGGFTDIQHSGSALSPLNALEAGGVDNLVVEMQLPASADNTYQGLSETITFSLDATQRAAENR